MAALETPLIVRLLDYLKSKRGIRVIGSVNADDSRVGTVSFVHESFSSVDIAATVNRESIGIRHGHMYAMRLCEGLGINPTTGVVRVSLLHYNTEEEIERLIQVLETIFV
jgi:selenocysteine lyase/cysteine desulfurase